MTAAPLLVIDAYDAALFDLDGVVYLGPVAVDGAAAGIRGLRQRRTKVGFVTNNAARTPRQIADHLIELGIAADPSDVVTSSQAAAHLVLQQCGPGATVLAVGGDGVREAVAEAGLVVVGSADDRPAAVVQGFGFDLTWEQLNEAAIAINRGAHWVATNTDPTRPTDRGLVPGNGAAVAAVRMAVTKEPEVAGKPFRPLLDDTLARLGARQPVFVGDRLDTDVVGATNAGMDSMLVLSGSSGPRDLLTAQPGARPTHLGADLRALLEPPRALQSTGDGTFRCGTATVGVRDERLELTGHPDSRLDALWAAAQTAWEAADSGQPADADLLLDILQRLP